VIVLLVALATSAVMLGVAGAERNDRIVALEHHGLPVVITVSGCTGLIGGSGSNDAGYACRAAYSVGGRHYQEGIPGDVDYVPGTRLAAVIDTTDPALVSPTDVLDLEHPSDRVFVLPAALLAAWTVLTCLVVSAGRRNRRRTPED